MKIAHSWILAVALFAWLGSATAATVSVRWIAPTENEDGTPATLAGFEIDYQTGAAGPIKTITVANPAARSYTIDNLPAAATVIVAMRAVGVDGQKSALSNVVRVTSTGVVIPPRPRPPVVIDPLEPGSITLTTERTNAVAPFPSPNLTALGPVDWFYSFRTAAGDHDHKIDGPLFVNPVRAIGGGVILPHIGKPVAYPGVSWSNGTPAATGTDERSIGYVPAIAPSGAGAEIVTGPLGLGRTKIVIGHGGWQASYDVIVSLSGGQPITERFVVPADQVYEYETTIDLRPMTATDTVSIAVRNAGADGNVKLRYGAATRSD